MGLGRFGDVSVRAGLESAVHVMALSSGAEHDDGQVGLDLSESFADLQTIHVGQHDVQDDEVGAFYAEHIQSLLTMLSSDNLMARKLKSIANHQRRVWIIVYD